MDNKRKQNIKKFYSRAFVRDKTYETFTRKIRKISLKVNAIYSCYSKQRAIRERVAGKTVGGRVPQAAAAHLHALSRLLADVDQDHDFISGDHEIFHARSDHLWENVKQEKRWWLNVDIYIYISFVHVYSPHILF